jgi:phosphate transport system substrate-binding protein
MNYIKKFSAIFFLAMIVLPAWAIEISGAGSSAAKPLYEGWASAYKQTGADSVVYDPIGSSGGVKKIKEHGVDFGASDVAMSHADATRENLICFPTAVSGVIPFFNVPGIKAGQINLSGPVLADIYQGKIKRWNDPAIAELNAGHALPALPIVVVARLDGSGTTYNFTDYLSKISQEWRDKFGTNFLIQWPATVQQVKGSSGVVDAVGKTTGAIGYVDYSYVLEHKLAYAKLQNRSGQFIEPTFDAFSAALNNSDWKTRASFDEMLTDKSGVESWPITAGTFAIIPKVANDPAKAVATLKFFSWAFLHGDDIARKSGSVRLTDSLQAKIYVLFTTVKDKNGKPLSWSLY